MKAYRRKEGKKQFRVFLSSTTIIFICSLVPLFADKDKNENSNYTVTEIDSSSVSFIDLNNSSILEQTNLVESEEITSSNSNRVDLENYPNYKWGVDENSVYLGNLENSSFKAWEADKFNPNSLQYQINQIAVSDEFGFRRINGEPLIALGKRFAPACGGRFEITLNDNGRIYSFVAVVGDVKAHTDDTQTFQRGYPNEHRIIEFIMDRDLVHPGIVEAGDVSEFGYPGEVMMITYLGQLEMNNNQLVI